MSETLPQGWRRRSLAEMGAYENGFAFNDQHWSEEGLPIVRIAQITGSQGIVDRYPGRLPDKFLLASGDMIFSWSGTLAVVRWQGGPAWLNQHLFKVTPAANIDAGFLFHVLSESVAEFDKRAHGSTMKHIKRGELSEHAVGVPDDPLEQSKIAEVLDTLDAAIRGTEAVVAKLRAMKQGLLHDLLTRGIDANGDLRPPHPEAPHLYHQTPLGWLPKEWDVVPLGTLTLELAQGWSPDCPAEAALAHEWGVLKTTAVVWSGYQDQENKRLPEGMKPRPHLQVEAGDILITRAGPSSRVAVVAHVPATRDKLMISDKLYRLRVIPQHNPAFLALAMGSTSVQREITKTISGMAESQTNISQSTLKPLPVPRPSRSEQDGIVQALQAQVRTLETEERLLDKLRLQKSGLMDDLLTGRVPVTPLL